MLTMFTRYLSWLLVFFAIFSPLVMSLDEEGGQSVRILVKYKRDGFLQELLDKYAIGRRLNINIAKRRIISINVENRELLEKIRGLIDEVDFAEEDNPMRIIRGDNYRVSDLQNQEVQPYGIGMVQADQLWEISEVDTDLAVCVVDTGYEAGHDDLPTILDHQVDGTNTEGGNWFQDNQGHGTHCAGTIGAIGDNGIGVVGVRKNPNLFQFHIGKGLNDEGTGYESDILAAVQGCVDHGARVVSMSLGGPGQSRTSRNFYADVYENDGVLVVAAAGNDGNTGYLYPAAYDHVMSVAAINDKEKRPSFSQCNDMVELTAPGVDVLSTLPNNQYGYMSGTSMACPHAAGVAAEVWARFPTCTNQQIRNVLLRSALHVGKYEGCHNGLGSGLIQAKAAYDLLASEGCEAGGSVSSVKPVGGCQQNPDFIASENPYYGLCPGEDDGTGGGSWGTFWKVLVGIIGAVALAYVAYIAYTKYVGMPQRPEYTPIPEPDREEPDYTMQPVT